MNSTEVVAVYTLANKVCSTISSVNLAEYVVKFWTFVKSSDKGEMFLGVVLKLNSQKLLIF